MCENKSFDHIWAALLEMFGLLANWVSMPLGFLFHFTFLELIQTYQKGFHFKVSLSQERNE